MVSVLQSRKVLIANPYQRSKINTYILFLLMHKRKLIFLGVLPVLMRNLFTSKTIKMNVYKHIYPLFWLRDSGKTTQISHHVPWEHFQMFQLMELTDVKNAHQVTSSFFCESSEEMQSTSSIRRVDEWTSGRVDGWTGGRVDGWTGGRVDGWTGGRVDGWTSGRESRRE